MKTYQKLIFFSIVGTFLVIIAGAVVRGTGSGLGCPDWPKCFGNWVPPTHVSQLPMDYKEIFKVAGKTIADFSPFKTWVEYINRLLGVFLGILILVKFIFSFSSSVKKYDHNLPWYSGGILLLIIMQGGLGALVVFTHLKPYLITAHMIVAIVLLFSLFRLQKYCIDLSETTLFKEGDSLSLTLTKLLTGVIFIQIILGTQVRQKVDVILNHKIDISSFDLSSVSIIEKLGNVFLTHRSFSILIVFLFLILLRRLHRNTFNREAFSSAFLAFVVVLGNVITGVALNYFGFPVYAQPLHLFFAILSISILYKLSLTLRGTLLND